MDLIVQYIFTRFLKKEIHVSNIEYIFISNLDATQRNIDNISLPRFIVFSRLILQIALKFLRLYHLEIEEKYSTLQNNLRLSYMAT